MLLLEEYRQLRNGVNTRTELEELICIRFEKKNNITRNEDEIMGNENPTANKNTTYKEGIAYPLIVALVASVIGGWFASFTLVKLTHEDNAAVSNTNKINQMQKDIAVIKNTEATQVGMATMNGKVDNDYTKLDGKIDSNFKGLNEKIDSNSKELNEKIDSNSKEINGRLDLLLKFVRH